MAEIHDPKAIKKMDKDALLVVARDKEGFDPKIHKTKAALLVFILGEKTKKNKKDLLLEEAVKFKHFLKSRHGANIAALQAFLNEARGGGVAEEKSAKRIGREDLGTMPYHDLLRLAKKDGYAGKDKKRPALMAFLEPRYDPKNADVPGRLALPSPAAGEKPPKEARDQLLEWPVSEETLKKHSGTVESLKALLAAKGIRVGLPRTKDEIRALFHKSRCSPAEFSCSDTEFCDLRNKLCRDLNILHDKNNEVKKFAKGFIYYDEEGRRFYGTPDAIAKVRAALAGSPPREEDDGDAEVVVAVKDAAVIQQQKQPHAKSPSPVDDEEGISPININRLLDQSSEKEIRKAILNCLGLYNDIDPNDEIVT
jgi:hypothetical protein